MIYVNFFKSVYIRVYIQEIGFFKGLEWRDSVFLVFMVIWLVREVRKFLWMFEFLVELFFGFGIQFFYVFGEEVGFELILFSFCFLFDLG